MEEKLMIPQYDFYYNIYERGGHTLVAGTNGSGKSVVLNGLIMTAILEHAQLILLDPKGGVEFRKYRDALDVIAFGKTLSEFRPALELADRIMMQRYNYMEENDIEDCEDKPLYVVIDEYAEMMSEGKKDLQPLLLKLARMGRAANVRLVLATQSPYKSIITGDIKGNMVNLIALRVIGKSYSRLIIDEPGAETLNVGEALVRLKGEFNAHREFVPMYPKDLLKKVAVLRTPPSKRKK